MISAPAVINHLARVPIIDDERANRELLHAMLAPKGYRITTAASLEDYGYQVFDASSPRAAEQIFDEHRELFSALVTDMMMPGSSGPQLYAALSKRNPSLKVLYVSGYTDDTIVQQGELDSESHFLQKPFSADELGRRLRDVLDS
ncbi:MAG: response regulator [Gemmatimonadaceae bacterium]